MTVVVLKIQLIRGLSAVAYSTTTATTVSHQLVENSSHQRSHNNLRSKIVARLHLICSLMVSLAVLV
jgi:hypothetical protein